MGKTTLCNGLIWVVRCFSDQKKGFVALLLSVLKFKNFVFVMGHFNRSLKLYQFYTKCLN